MTKNKRLNELKHNCDLLNLTIDCTTALQTYENEMLKLVCNKDITEIDFRQHSDKLQNNCMLELYNLGQTVGFAILDSTLQIFKQVRI
jgi:hypothetical protein